MAGTAWPDLTEQRNRLVDQIERQGVVDARVLEALRSVPRENFLPPELREFAYRDSPLPIDNEQTISQPFVVALMTSALELEPEDRVLEIGTGSGYAAAVLAKIADEVYTVERYDELAKSARQHLSEQGFENVHILHGDGTQGWPEHAPYNAIVVAAGGPEVPKPLLKQLEVGGRLVIPVGRHRTTQNLVCVHKRHENDFEKEELGAVRFVPLIGAAGWNGEESQPVGNPTSKLHPPQTAAELIANEADWPDAARINRYVQEADGEAPAKWEAFARFPTWMWRNAEVLDYLDRTDPEAARIARQRYGCLTPWEGDPETYGRAAITGRYRECEEEAVSTLQDLLERRLEYAACDGLRFFDAAQNARLVADAERYYRIMYFGGVDSWNLRDTHMSPVPAGIWRRGLPDRTGNRPRHRRRRPVLGLADGNDAGAAVSQVKLRTTLP